MNDMIINSKKQNWIKSISKFNSFLVFAVFNFLFFLLFHHLHENDFHN